MVDRDLSDRADHCFISDDQDRDRRLLDAESERLSDLGVESGASSVDVEPQAAAEKVLRIEISADQSGVSHGGARTPACVTNGARLRSSALRSDPRQAAIVDPGDAAAARANAMHSDGRDTQEVPCEFIPKPSIAARSDLTLADEGDIEAGSTGVVHDYIRRLDVCPCIGPRCDGRYGRA